MDKQRYVYGAVCTWHGSIDETKTTAPMSFTLERPDGSKADIDSRGVPCCPHCGGVLMEYPSIDGWRESAAKFCQQTGLNYDEYYAWLEWLVRVEDGGQVKCTPIKGWDWRISLEEFRRKAAR